LWRVITENEQRKADADASAKEKKKRKLARSEAKKVYHLPRARKVRVYLDAAQKVQLKQWFGVVRRAYNTGVVVHRALRNPDSEIAGRVAVLAVEEKTDGDSETKKNKDGKVLVRGRAAAIKQVVREMEREEKLAHVLAVPQALRDSGIRDMTKAVKSGAAKNEEKGVRGEAGVVEQFTFRSRKDRNQTMEINARDWNSESVQATFFKAFKTKHEQPPVSAEAAVRVQMDRTGRVFLCFVKEVEAKGDNQAPSREGVFHSTAALDPGVRTFQAIYDADGQGIE
jgi:hypothetical protein